MMKLDTKKENGFTLAELLIVVAIVSVLVAISIPVFTSQLEKSREATDLANVRAAYAQIMAEAMETDTPTPISVHLKQKQEDWQTSLPITIGGITFNGEFTDNWKETPEKQGICVVSYGQDVGAVFNWKGGFYGDLQDQITGFFNYKTTEGTGNMNTNAAYYTGRKFQVGAKEVTVRVYCADSPDFAKALEDWTPHPCGYQDSPFYKVEDRHGGETEQGFAYYTYGEDKKINSFIYVSPTNIYETTDEGKTWYDITPSENTNK